MNTKNIIRLFVLVAVFLSIPFILNWPWSAADFVIAGALLLGAGFAYLFATRNADNKKRRIITGVLVFLVLAYIWAELAVGIFNIPGISGN
jgi:ABC-type uncharacterized transport system permease subunit